MAERPRITIYTDGGAKPNPGPGGWGALLIAGNDYTKELSGAAPATTNNRMELTAAIEALRALKKPCQVTLHTDSEYLRNGIDDWLDDWLANGWMTTQDTPVQNRDLWQALHAETQRHTITWQWVKGHAGDARNERVDQLATAARRRLTGEQFAPDPTPAAEPDALNIVYEIALRVSAPRSPGEGQHGGWAARIAERSPDTGTGTVITGRLPDATSSQLVLVAAAEALRTLPTGVGILVHCPDEYLYKGMTEWVPGWQQRGWRTASKKPVQHTDLWQALLVEVANRPVRWQLESRQDDLPIARGLAKLAADAAASQG
jgi:ribonuclease HI